MASVGVTLGGHAPPPPMAPVAALVKDTDRDGIPDEQDKCPNEAGPKENGGCPDKDSDGDGIVDRKDKCPDKAGPPEREGCPEEDADKDGIVDSKDKCPNDAEDKDGFEDEDGCPDLDNDKDGVPDAEDKCPNEPETKNGYQDEDGCPDEVPAPIKKFTGVIKGINFRRNSADIKASSFPLLKGAVQVFKEYPALRVEISGHTSNEGRREFNMKLSRKRAEAVKDYLVSAGIDEKRIGTVGYGPDKPIADNNTHDGQEKNRRIEFRLLSPKETIQNQAEPEDINPTPERKHPKAKGAARQGRRRKPAAAQEAGGQEEGRVGRRAHAEVTGRPEVARVSKRARTPGRAGRFLASRRTWRFSIVAEAPFQNQGQRDVGLDGRRVVDAGDFEAEQAAEVGAEAGVVGDGREVFGRDLVPQGRDARLDGRAPARGRRCGCGRPSSVDGWRPGREVVAKEPHDLLGGPLVRARLLHHLVENADVKRHHRDGRRGLRDQPLVDADPGGAADAAGEPGRQLARLRLQVLLGLADRARPVDGERQRRTDVAVGDGAAAPRQQVGLAQRAHPVGEVLAAHHLARGLDLGVAGGRDLDGHDLIVAQVDALAAVGGPQRLQHRVVRRAGRRVGAPGRSQAVDDQIQPGADALQVRQRLLFHLAAEGVAVDDRHVAPRRARPLLQGGQVVPAGRGGLVPLRRPLEADGGPARAVPEHRAGQAGQPVARCWRRCTSASATPLPGAPAFATAISASTLAAHPAGCAFSEMKPRIREAMTWLGIAPSCQSHRGGVKSRPTGAATTTRIPEWLKAVPCKSRMNLASLKRILVPTDFTDPSNEALETAIELARGAGATVDLVHVAVEAAYPLPPPIDVATLPLDMDRVLDRSDQGLAAEEKRVRAAGLACETTTLIGRADTEIVEPRPRHPRRPDRHGHPRAQRLGSRAVRQQRRSRRPARPLPGPDRPRSGRSRHLLAARLGRAGRADAAFR